MVTRIACAAAVLACLSAASVEAQTWDGGGVAGGDVNWSVGTNWVGDVAPVNNGNAGIVMAGMIDTTNTVDINYDINTLTFNTTDGFTINNSGGATLTIRGGGIHNNSGQSQTINAPVALFGNQIWHANTGSLNFGAVNLAGSQLTLTSSLPSTVTTISGEISSSVGSGQLRPEGSGTLTLGGTNTFSGGVVLSSGTLRLNNDAALGTGTLFVQGSGGTIEAGTAPRIIANAINLQGNLTTGGAFNIDFSGAATLNANRTITVNNGLTTFSGVMGQLGGGQSLTKAGTGTVTFSGTSANTYTGNTNVNAGTLLLSKTTGVDAIRSPFVSIGDNSGGPGADVVRLAASNQITNTSQVLIYSTGAFDLNGNSETIGALEIHDGSVTTGAGILTLNTGGITTSSATFGTAMISGNLNLGSATRTVNVGNGAATVELDISAAIANGAITKTGAGTLQFSGTSANTYTGTTTINEGRLVLAKTTANGAILGDLIIGNGGGADEVEIAQPNQIAATANVTVNAGANLLVSAAEDGFGLLTLNGGSVTIGATGSLTIANDVAADRGVGELTVQIDGMDRPLLLNGARTFNVTGGGDPIIDFNTNARLLGGTLVKTGFGTMTLTGTLDNTTAGIINEGVLFLAKPDNVAALEGNIVIGDGIGGIEGDILQLGNDEQLKQTASDTLTINSSGLFVLSNNTETIGNLVLNGGHVDEGTLRMLGSVTVNSSPQTAVIFSDIDLGFASTNFDVNDGAAIVELDMIGDITNGTLNKTGAGTMSLEGTATNSSTINLNEGTLLLANALAAAIAGSLDVGDGFSGPGTDVVRLMADDQLADTAAAVSVQSSGLLDLNGFSDTVGALFISGGSIATGGGTLTLSSDLEVFGHPQMASIDGNLNLGNAPRTFFVEDGAAAIDLDISATIAAETGGQLIKTGAGTLQLDGTVHAPLVLNAGTLTGLSTIGPIGSFTQNAGTFDGTLTNQGTFTYNGGTFAGQLINEGIATLGDDLTAGNGVINFGTIALGVGQSLTTDGAGLENQGSITLTSGTIDGNGPLVNNSLLSGRGMIAGSAGFANNGAVSVAGGNLSLTNSGANANTGLITVPFGLQLRLLGGILTNTGTINLDGGSVSGTATLVNEAGGIVQGGSSVQAPMTNNGGLIHANAGTTLIITNLSGGNTNGGELRIDNGSGINVTNAFNSSGTIVLLGANAQLIGGAVTNTGTLRGSGRVSNSVLNSGTVLAEDDRLTLSGSGHSNTAAGIIEAHAEAEIFYSQGLATNAGQIALLGGRFDNNNRTLDNDGSIAGDGVIRTGGLTNDGSIGVGGGDLDLIGPVTNNTTVSIQSGSTARFFGPVNGPGNYSGTGTTMFLNSFSPGASPAEVSFGGDLVFGAASSLNMELAGMSPGTQYDRLVVAGSASLAGDLNVMLLDGFAPGAGNAFEIITAAGGVMGTFDDESLPSLAANLEWEVLYNTNSVILQVLSTVLVGDYNLNGVVDAADYIIWRKTLGQTGAGLAADGNGDGEIDAGDYGIWRAHFGQTAGSGSHLLNTAGPQNPVPEPNGLQLFVVGGMLLAVAALIERHRSQVVRSTRSLGSN